MAKYIKVEGAIEAAINGCASWDGGYFPSMDDPIKDEFASIEDKCIEIVRCGECKYWWEENELCKHPNHCEGYVCVHECGASSFCSDGERKDGEHDAE